MKTNEQSDAIINLEAYMKENQCEPLDLEAIRRLTEAYKDLLNVKLDELIDLEAVLRSLVDEDHMMAISSTADRVRDEARAICSDVNDIIDNVLLWNAIGDRERAFIYKFKGDICGNKWAMNSNDIISCEQASKAYFNALTICKWNFEPTDIYLLETALCYSTHLNKANKFDEAVATLTGIISSAQETLNNNGDNEIAQKKFVESILEDLNNTLEFSRVNSNLQLAKLIEELESQNHHRGEVFVEEESWDNVDEELWDEFEGFQDDVKKELRSNIEDFDEELYHVTYIELEY